MNLAALDLSRKSQSPETKQLLSSEMQQLQAAEALKRLFPQLLHNQKEKRKSEGDEGQPECKKSKTESSVSPLDLSFKSGDVDSNTSDSGNHSDEQGKINALGDATQSEPSSVKSRQKETKQDGNEKQVWRLPIPELAGTAQSQTHQHANPASSVESDEKIKNLLKVVQLLRQVQTQKAAQGTCFSVYLKEQSNNTRIRELAKYSATRRQQPGSSFDE